MSQVFAAFGIDWRLLIINSVNFVLLLLALWYFLYGPLLRMLKTRQEKVAQGVRDAQEAQARLQEIEGAQAHLLAEAGAQADEVVSHARAAATAKEAEIVKAGEATAAAMLKDAQAQAQELKRQALEESKQEVAKLIVLGVEKTLRQGSGQALPQ